VTSVTFSPDGQRLASGSFDSTVKIWDSATGKELVTLKGHAAVNSVAFSPDGQCLACNGEDGSIDLRETNVAPEMREPRAVHQLVADLFGQLILRSDVVEWLQTAPGMTLIQRQTALAVAGTHSDDPLAWNRRAWEAAWLPGREMSDYRKALRYSEAACRIEPKNRLYLTTLGVAYYRAGNYEKALDTLLRAEQINKTLIGGAHLADLAFLAMARQQLGRVTEAQAELQRLRERVKDPRWAKSHEAQVFLREAEALLAKPKPPGDK
jgi:tetratricopeptide (TPR) repeat protein